MTTSKSKFKEEVKKAMEEVAEEVIEEVASESMQDKPPGTIVDRGKPSARKVPWTRGYLKTAFPQVTFVPEETIPITVQGITFQLIADQEVTVPSVVRGIYDDHRKAMRRHPVIPGVNVNLGYGGLEPEKIVVE